MAVVGDTHVAKLEGRMRRLAIGMGLAVVMLVGTSSRAHAQAKSGYGMAGCGLGSILFGTDNSKLMQLIAATVNGTGVQTFGITSGTSNCVDSGVVKAEREQAAFAEVNFQDLKRNMASGGGEYLSSFSSLLGCTDTSKATFFKMTQEKYESLLPSEKTTPIAMLVSVKQQIKATPALATSCSDERAVARAQGGDKAVSVALAKTSSKSAAVK
jgi:Protein of unknown function (DUF3015)